MTKRIPRRQTEHAMLDEHTRKVFQVRSDTQTVCVYGRTADDARHTCDVHCYLADDGSDWEVVQVHSNDPGVDDAYEEAERRFDKLHAAP